MTVHRTKNMGVLNVQLIYIVIFLHVNKKNDTNLFTGRVASVHSPHRAQMCPKATTM